MTKNRVHRPGRTTSCSAGFTNSYTSYGGIVGGGHNNTISGPYASFLGGAENTATGTSSTITGGPLQNKSKSQLLHYQWGCGELHRCSHLRCQHRLHRLGLHNGLRDREWRKPETKAEAEERIRQRRSVNLATTSTTSISGGCDNLAAATGKP